MAAAAAAPGDATVERLAANLVSMGFFGPTGRFSGDSLKVARAIHERALLVSKATGDVRDYARAAGTLAWQAAKEGGAASEAEGEAEVDATVLDISGGAREFLDAERAGELLERLSAAGSLVTHVKLSGKSFGVEAAGVAAERLAAAGERLVSADLSDTIAGRPEDEALAAMTAMCKGLASVQLEELDLSDNAFGEKGVRAARAAFEAQRSLRSLKFQNNGISKEAAAAIAEILPDESAATLRRLHFFNNMTGDEGAGHLSRLLAKCRSMEDFRCSSTRVGAAGGAAMAAAMAGATNSLRRLDLADNVFGEQGAIALAHCIAVQPKLEYAKLGDLGACDRGIEAICAALAHSGCPLRELDLSSNDLTETAAMPLARLVVLKRATLERLVLSENDMGDKAAVVLGGAMEKAGGCPALASIEMNCCELSRVGALALAKGALAGDSKPMVSVDDNMVSAAGVAQLEELLGDRLGSMEGNDEDGGDSDDGEGTGDASGAVDMLANALSGLGV